MLVSLIYCSRATEPVTEATVRAILDASERHNPALAITGMLCFGQGYFLQALEGPRAEVNRTYHRISADPRHDSLLLLAYREIDRRDFAGWAMGYIGMGEDCRRILAAYRQDAAFLPAALRGEEAHALMRELRQRLLSQTDAV